MQLDIPGFGTIELKHLVSDFNGVLAVDGSLLPGIAERLTNLSTLLDVHIVSADTFGTVEAQLHDLPCRLHILEPDSQEVAKLEYVRSLGSRETVALGNGANDRLMLKEAGLSIAVLAGEGALPATILSADIVVPDALAGLDLLSHPKRIVATLRR